MSQRDNFNTKLRDLINEYKEEVGVEGITDTLQYERERILFIDYKDRKKT